MIQRYFIELSYKGTAYHGWQVQPNAITIQQVLEECIEKLLRKKIWVTGAGRTDTGVHARNFTAHFELEGDLRVPFTEIHPRLNHMLPDDIAIKNIYPVSPEAHSRFSALSRTYHYYINLIKDPFTRETALSLFYTPDMELMNQAAKYLTGENNYSSFCRSNSGVTNFWCKVYQAQWIETDNGFVFIIKANRFLRNMVRAIVGTLLEVGKHKITPQQFQTIMEANDRRKAGMSAPANGLILVDIEYPPELFKNRM